MAAALIVGAVAGTFVMLWLGERIGLSSYNKNLASSPKGTLFPASLSLGAKSVLAFWPLFTAIVVLVAEWGTRPPALRSSRARSRGRAQEDDPAPAANPRGRYRGEGVALGTGVRAVLVGDGTGLGGTVADGHRSRRRHRHRRGRTGRRSSVPGGGPPTGRLGRSGSAMPSAPAASASRSPPRWRR